MQKLNLIISSTAFMVFGSLILAISIVNQSAEQASQNLGLASPRPTIISPQAIDILVPSHGNYQLPYPGLLPTHPLYPVRMLRDRLILTLSPQPPRQARLLFDYSNIRMSAANQLIISGQIDAAISTAIKGQTYLWRTINAIQQLDLSTRIDLSQQLHKAMFKHEEVIEKIRLASHDSGRDQADRLHQQLDEYRQQVINLAGKPIDLVPLKDSDLPTASASANL